MFDFLPKDINFRLIKILDIGFITVIYCLVAMVVSRILDNIFIKYNKLTHNDKTPYFIQLLLELIVMTWIIGVSTYIVRNLVELIPSPFDGMEGLVHKRVKELGGAGVYTFILMSCTKSVTDKVKEFNEVLKSIF
jgi:hypothetical protein